MKKRQFVSVMVLTMLTLAACASAQTAQAPVGVVNEMVAVMQATVVAIDLQKRIVTLKGPDGEIRDLKVGEEAVNLPQVKVGDIVTVKYYESIAVEVIKPGAAVAAGESSAIARAKPGEMPGGVAARQVTVTATITAIDKAKGTLTLKGPEGKLNTVKVQDPANLDKVKVGDDLMITFTEALAISVEHAKTN